MDSLTLLWQLITSSDTTFSEVDVSLARLAEVHGVAPLLYRCLKEIDLPVSIKAGQFLEKSYYLCAGRSQLLKAELDQLAAALDTCGIPYLPLKGAALAWSIYPNPALRPMIDLDLLVSPVDLKRAVDASRGCGYRLDKLTYHALLRGGPDYSISLELHWCLPGGEAVPTELLSNSSKLRGELFELFTYIYCIGHLLRQHPDNPRLIWLYDLHILEECTRDREALHELARQLGLSVELALYENQTFPPQFPPGIKFMDVARKSLGLLPPRTRLGLSSAMLFPSPAYMKWRYHPRPEWLWPAYYPSRLAEWKKLDRQG